ncbi:hypothetical protein KJ636_03490 [Patescibacteria group bacterium]|nr:hypothetical protein [Patescibacteria group bacterium]MBU4481005.1 hypothetical protein [Patescibacteria group bacterium]
MPTLPIINDESLKGFIQSVGIDEKDKNFLLSKLPEMDFDERKALFEALTKIHLLDLEEEKALAAVDKYLGK